ncbi:hypothetical protein HYH03_001431 [Edaphochlamys debaryana]|uniref:Uncharacterized protein n=1 Tax=Edaphochlamys debaryana TaxID=47281 RepID=A0A836C595_9CHLO|nr:hypothetical protein HYH03_001431 [Edaphochlamys debaryana]|eukprot:KAG2500665.1 hypothetical protein HYH03_001431 [Edaphochlamys debaryana]
MSRLKNTLELTLEEEELLVQGFMECGARWTRIAERLPGRTAKQVKSLWYGKLRTKSDRCASLLGRFVRNLAAHPSGRNDAQACEDAYALAVAQRDRDVREMERQDRAAAGISQGPRSSSSQAPGAASGSAGAALCGDRQGSEGVYERDGRGTGAVVKGELTEEVSGPGSGAGGRERRIGRPYPAQSRSSTPLLPPPAAEGPRLTLSRQGAGSGEEGPAAGGRSSELNGTQYARPEPGSPQVRGSGMRATVELPWGARAAGKRAGEVDARELSHALAEPPWPRGTETLTERAWQRGSAGAAGLRGGRPHGSPVLPPPRSGSGGPQPAEAPRPQACRPLSAPGLPLSAVVPARFSTQGHANGLDRRQRSDPPPHGGYQPDRRVMRAEASGRYPDAPHHSERRHSGQRGDPEPHPRQHAPDPSSLASLLAGPMGGQLAALLSQLGQQPGPGIAVAVLPWEEEIGLLGGADPAAAPREPPPKRPRLEPDSDPLPPTAEPSRLRLASASADLGRDYGRRTDGPSAPDRGQAGGRPQQHPMSHRPHPAGNGALVASQSAPAPATHAVEVRERRLVAGGRDQAPPDGGASDRSSFLASARLRAALEAYLGDAREDSGSPLSLQRALTLLGRSSPARPAAPAAQSQRAAPDPEPRPDPDLIAACVGNRAARGGTLWPPAPQPKPEPQPPPQPQTQRQPQARPQLPPQYRGQPAAAAVAQGGGHGHPRRGPHQDRGQPAAPVSVSPPVTARSQAPRAMQGELPGNGLNAQHESLAQYERTVLYERLLQYERPAEHERPAQYERSVQHERPPQYERSVQYERPAEYERSVHQEWPVQYERPAQYERPVAAHERPAQQQGVAYERQPGGPAHRGHPLERQGGRYPEWEDNVGSPEWIDRIRALCRQAGIALPPSGQLPADLAALLYDT